MDEHQVLEQSKLKDTFLTDKTVRISKIVTFTNNWLNNDFCTLFLYMTKNIFELGMTSHTSSPQFPHCNMSKKNVFVEELLFGSKLLLIN